VAPSASRARRELDIHIKRLPDPERLADRDNPCPTQGASRTGHSTAGRHPYDPRMMEFEFNGRPLVELPDEAPIYQSVAAMMQAILAA
jgi:hypothetical protein